MALAGLLLVSYSLIKLIFVMNVGIDLTDEGYYLNWISNPWLYQYYVSQFGYIYHPIYKLLGNNLVYLRQFNALFTYTLGFLLSYLILTRYSDGQNKVFFVAIGASIALPSLLILMITGHWLPSPSYNSLCFQGLMITVMGLVLSDSKIRYGQALSACSIGLGGWLVFMAKPSSALLLVAAVPLYYALELKKYWRLLLGAALVAATLVLLTAVSIDGSILQFIKRYQLGLSLLDVMASNHEVKDLLRLDLFNVSTANKYRFLLLTGLITCVFLCIQRRFKNLILPMTMVLSATIGVILWHAISTNGIKISTPRYHPLILLAPLFAAMLCWPISHRFNTSLKPKAKLIFILVLLPYIYAAGSANNYWETAAGAMLFWTLASWLILERSSVGHTQKIVLAVIVASITIKVLLAAQNSPYRQTEAIAQQSSRYINPHTQTVLLLPKDTATYLNDLSHLLHQSDFKKHTPVIDFTGHHPGTLYFMQAKAIGQAWAIGGYDGSNDLAALALNQASCHEIANAWLIIEKDGRHRIDFRVLEKHGILADKNHYTKVGMINTKVLTDPGFVNPSHPDGRYEQYFLKPNSSDKQEKSCLAYRQQGRAPHF